MDETLDIPPSKGSDGSIWSTEVPLHLVPLLNGTPTSNFFPSSPDLYHTRAVWCTRPALGLQDQSHAWFNRRHVSIGPFTLAIGV
jgi:hypothetical protein